MLKIGVTGGIGSGKSTLCNHFQMSGIPLYDSDRRAKELMNRSETLRAQIIELFGEDAYFGGSLNRAFLADQIFHDTSKREALNAIVHPAVRLDFLAWAEAQGDSVPYVLLESAILFDGDLSSYIDYTVAVLAPEELRITRVVNRDGCTVDQAKSRIAAQMSDNELHERADYSVVNIFEEDLEGAAQRLDQIFKGIAFKANGAS
ncbi:MAG: dephospho-CoA kinase [Rikenellaceae bacterium]